LSIEQSDLELLQSVKTGTAKQKILKVMCKRKDDSYEMFEFMDLNPNKDKYFDVLAISDIQIPLWNVPDIFVKF
jgi:hypothetical protein